MPGPPIGRRGLHIVAGSLGRPDAKTVTAVRCGTRGRRAGQGVVIRAASAQTVASNVVAESCLMANIGLFKRLFGASFSDFDRREKPRVNAREGTRVLIVDDSP